MLFGKVKRNNLFFKMFYALGTLKKRAVMSQLSFLHSYLEATSKGLYKKALELSGRKSDRQKAEGRRRKWLLAFSYWLLALIFIWFCACEHRHVRREKVRCNSIQKILINH
jgi:hypothetical protein